jgi:hypothetical protein
MSSEAFRHGGTPGSRSSVHQVETAGGEGSGAVLEAPGVGQTEDERQRIQVVTIADVEALPEPGDDLGIGLLNRAAVELVLQLVRGSISIATKEHGPLPSRRGAAVAEPDREPLGAVSGSAGGDRFVSRYDALIVERIGVT